MVFVLALLPKDFSVGDFLLHTLLQNNWTVATRSEYEYEVEYEYDFSNFVRVLYMIISDTNLLINW